MAQKVAVDLSKLDGIPDDVLTDFRFTSEVTGRSMRSLRRDIKAGRLTDIKICGSRRIRVGDIRAMVAGKRPTKESHPTAYLARVHAERQGHYYSPAWDGILNAQFNPPESTQWDDEAMERFVILGAEQICRATTINPKGQRVSFAPAMLDAAEEAIKILRGLFGGGADHE